MFVKLVKLNIMPMLCTEKWQKKEYSRVPVVSGALRLLVMTSLYFYIVGALLRKPLLPEVYLCVLGQSGIDQLATGLVQGLFCVRI